MSQAPDEASAVPTCARCARTPRDADDLHSWAEIDGDEICPGCMTLSDNEQLRDDDR